MSSPSSRNDSHPKEKPGDQRRQERLRAALRENLKRRKAQARGRTTAEPDDSQGGEDSEES
jgi:hypothetical protein